MESSSHSKLNLKKFIRGFLIFAMTLISVGGVSLFPLVARYPLILCSGIITAGYILFKQKKVFITTPVTLMLLSVAYTFISVFYSLDKGFTLLIAAVYLCSALLLLADYPENLYESAIKAIKIVCIVIAISIIMSSFIDNCMLKYFWFIVNPTHSPSVTTAITQELRWSVSYSGFAREKGEAAFIMNIGICTCFATYFSQRKFTFSDWVCILMFFWALLLTSKRMLFICPIATISIMLLISKKKGRFQRIIPLVLLAVCGIVVVGANVPDLMRVFERFLDTDSMQTLSGRVYLWPHCFDMFFKSPLIGMGMGSFNQYLENINFTVDGEYWTHHAHNIYYQFLGELGIIGCLLLWGSLLMLLYRTIQLLRSDQTTDDQKYLLIFSCSLQIICFIYCASGNVLLFAQEIYPWFMSLGITTTISNKLKRQQRNTQFVQTATA